MATIAELFHLALRHHQGGNLALAENHYRQVLQADPRHADAWHFLGVLAVQVGRYEMAVECIGQALRLNPASAEAHCNLGAALSGQGKVQEAEACYRQALRLKPDYADAHNNLGNVLRDQGKPGLAEACYRQALQFKPQFAEAHNNLGSVLWDQGRLDEAESTLRQALRGRPSYAEAHHNLGSVLHDQGKLEEAEASCRQALQLKPAYVEAHKTLGSVLHDQGKLQEAEACYRTALRLQPDYVEAYNNLGNVLRDQGRIDEAQASYRQALALKPDFAEADLNLGLSNLLLGNLAEGWPAYERRLSMERLHTGALPATWDGGPLNGQTILLQAEQGVGDAFQFVRYARVVKGQGGRVVLQCSPALAPILATCPGVDQVVAAGAPLPAYDLTAPLLSLPLLCRTTLATIPAEVPYLAVDPARVQSWRSRLAAVPGFKVGICWQGNPKLKRDRLRSVPLAAFAPLAAVPGVSLVALQRGPGLEQIAQQSEALRIVDLPGRSADAAEGWLDTAELIQALDLVISVDTAVVHLAGALGAPVWVTLPLVPDWRWLLQREDSPWYPTARLFRQQRQGDWPEVFERIAGALQHRVAA